MDDAERVEVLERRQERREHGADRVRLAHRAAAPVELAEDVAARRELGDEVDAGGVLEGREEAQDVRVVERRVDSYLAAHLVRVELRELRAVVDLERDLLMY